MKKLIWFFLFGFSMLISACDQTKETLPQKENNNFSGQDLNQQNKAVSEAKDLSENSAALKTDKREVLPLPTEITRAAENKAPLKLELEVTDIPALDEDQSDRSLFSDDDFESLFEDTSKDKQLNISSDVILSEDAIDTEIRVEDMIKQIDGAEVNLEYKF
ncbi:MAG: hypothetical protein QNJ56_09760 [Gammaproteobacteria bacterium]|nr:hypothetical protein [Gammaproteobacteria bacterium]